MLVRICRRISWVTLFVSFSLLAGFSLSTLAQIEDSEPGIPETLETPETLDRAELEAQLEAVELDIRSLMDDLAQQRDRFQQEQAKLREVELAIQDTAREIVRLMDQQRTSADEIQSLKDTETRILEDISAEQGALGAQIAQAYRLQRQSRLKLLLNQDDPDQVSRLLAYFDYYNRARKDEIDQLQLALEPLIATRRQIQTAIQALDELVTRTTARQQALEIRRADQADATQALAEAIGGSEQRVAELQRNRADLEALLKRLSQVLADIPEDLGSGERLVSQKGNLPWPVTGPVRYGFGQNHNGTASRGWLISAEPGTEIQSVGYGRVAFADWLRGFGLLLIVDHGDELLSLYGHADTLLRDVGDWVTKGDRLATAGSSGGAEESGLYFELRRAGSPVDPAIWLGPRDPSQ